MYFSVCEVKGESRLEAEKVCIDLAETRCSWLMRVKDLNPSINLELKRIQMKNLMKSKEKR